MLDLDTALKVLQIVAAAIAILMPIAVIPFWKLINKVRTNDLHHLDLKIDEHHKLMGLKVDTVSSAIKDVKNQVADVATNLNDHIKWHLDQR